LVGCTVTISSKRSLLPVLKLPCCGKKSHSSSGSNSFETLTIGFASDTKLSEYDVEVYCCSDPTAVYPHPQVGPWLITTSCWALLLIKRTTAMPKKKVREIHETYPSDASIGSTATCPLPTSGNISIAGAIAFKNNLGNIPISTISRTNTAEALASRGLLLLHCLTVYVVHPKMQCQLP